MDKLDLLVVECLPTEILSHILVLYAADAFERWTSRHHGTQIVPDYLVHGLAEEQPLRLYRRAEGLSELAYDCSQLSRILEQRCNTELLLERSKYHALDIFCLASDITGVESRHDVLALALNHLRRIRSLQLIVHSRDTGNESRILYEPATAPLLQSLLVYFAEDKGDGSVTTRNAIRDVGRMKWTTPRLRQYKIYSGTRSMTPDEDFAPFQFKDTLTQLVCLPAKASRSDTPFFCAGDVLSVVRSLPHLATLHIRFPKRPRCARRPRTAALSLSAGTGRLHRHLHGDPRASGLSGAVARSLGFWPGLQAPRALITRCSSPTSYSTSSIHTTRRTVAPRRQAHIVSRRSRRQEIRAALGRTLRWSAPNMRGY